jgi:uncharacterized membrane protein YuzA (DUF378 family)
MNKSYKINLHILLMVLVIVGSLNWGLVGIFNFDLVKQFGSLFGNKMQHNVSSFIYILVGMAALILLIQRDTFLPFLGHTVMPKPINEYKPSGDVITKKIENLPPNVKVIYWAALPSDKTIDNPYDAYGEYTNQGVTTSDANGIATLTVQKPTDYKVPLKGTLKHHIHYRYWTSAGMASRLYRLLI